MSETANTDHWSVSRIGSLFGSTAANAAFEHGISASQY